MDAIERGRARVMACTDDLARIAEAPSVDAIEQAGHCGVCVAGMDGPPCAHCLAQDLFEVYESRLFLLSAESAKGAASISAEAALSAHRAKISDYRERMRERENKHTTPPTNGAAPGGGVLMPSGLEDVAAGRSNAASNVKVTWAPSEAESLLRMLASSLRSIPGGAALSQAAKKHLSALDAMRREFGLARALAEAQRSVLHALDELHMATTRVRLRFPGEQLAGEHDALFKILAEEVPAMSAKLSNDKFAAADDVARARGQLRYLKVGARA
eukprot:jgi/Mesen1/183/ME1135971C07684